MSMRDSWPHIRTDVLGIACLAVVAGCLTTFKWPGIVALALGVALFCAVSPRMRGPFGFSNGGTRIGGSFEEEPKLVLKAKVSEGDPSESEDQPPPSSREPSED